MTHSNKLSFGTTETLETGSPMIGRMYEDHDLSVGLVAAKPYEVHFQAPQDVFSIQLSPLDIHSSYNSSRLISRSLRIGDIGWHPAGTEVSAASNEKDGEFVHFGVPRAWRQELFEEMPRLRNGAGAEFKVIQGGQNAIAIAQLARRYLLGDTPALRLAAQSVAMLALSETLTALSEASTPNLKSGFTHQRLSRITDYIEAHLQEDLGLAELAAQVGLTAYHFARSFKQATGITPHQYVLERRIARARDMLSSGQASIAAIAYDVGFSSQSHMTEVFRKSLGITPARYRKDNVK